MKLKQGKELVRAATEQMEKNAALEAKLGPVAELNQCLNRK
jgi:hypothetical protein